MNDSQKISRWVRKLNKSYVGFVTIGSEEYFESFMKVAWGDPRGKKRRLINTSLRTDDTFVLMFLDVMASRNNTSLEEEKIFIEAFRKLVKIDENGGHFEKSASLISGFKEVEKKSSLLRVFSMAYPDVIPLDSTIEFKSKEIYVKRCLDRLEVIVKNLKKKIKVHKIRIDSRGKDKKIFVIIKKGDKEIGLSPLLSRIVVSMVSICQQNKEKRRLVPFAELVSEMNMDDPNMLRNQWSKDKTKIKEELAPVTIDLLTCVGTPFAYLAWDAPRVQAKHIRSAWESPLRIKKKN